MELKLFSVNGRFHYFEATKELIKRNRLKNLITSIQNLLFVNLNKKIRKMYTPELIKRLPLLNNKKVSNLREKLQKYIFSKFQLLLIDKSTDIFMGLASYQKMH